MIIEVKIETKSLKDSELGRFWSFIHCRTLGKTRRLDEKYAGNLDGGVSAKNLFI